MLCLHAFFVLSLLELKFAEVFLGNSELVVQFRNFVVILSLLVKSLKCFFLFSLNFYQGLTLFL
jgi:hypothetical protein